MKTPKKLPPLRVPDAHRLSVKEQLFVGQIMEGKSAGDAAEFAGYSRSSGQRLLGEPHIAAEIRRRQQALVQRAVITEDMVVNELAKVAFSNLGDMWSISPITGDPYIDFDKLTDAQKAAISEVKIEYDPVRSKKGEQASDMVRMAKRVTVKLHPKLAALEALGKHLGLFRERIEVTHAGEITHKVETAKVLEHMSDDAIRELEKAIQVAQKGDAEDIEGE